MFSSLYLILFCLIFTCKSKENTSGGIVKAPNIDEHSPEFNFLNYNNDFRKKTISNQYTLKRDQYKKIKYEKISNTKDFIQSYLRSDNMISIKVDNKKIEYQKMYMHHGVNCWIEASLVCLLYYFNLGEWKSFFNNIEKVLLNHPFVEALESNKLPNYQSVSHGKLKDLFLDAKAIILKMKDSNCDPNFFDKDSYTNKKIKAKHLHKLVIFIRQVIVITDAIQQYYYNNNPDTFSLFSKDSLNMLHEHPGNINNPESKEISTWFLNLLKLIKNKLNNNTKIKSKIDNEIKNNFHSLNVNNIDELIVVLQKSLDNFSNEINDQKSKFKQNICKL